MISIEPFNISNPWTVLGYVVIIVSVIIIPELNKTASQAFYYVRNSIIKRDRTIQEVDTSTKLGIHFRVGENEFWEKTNEEKLEVIDRNPSIKTITLKGLKSGKVETVKVSGSDTDYSMKVYCKSEDGRTTEVFGKESQYRVDENTRLGKENQVHWFDYSTTDLNEAYQHEVALNVYNKDQIEELMGGKEYVFDRETTYIGKGLDKVKPKYFMPGKSGKVPIEGGGESGGE